MDERQRRELLANLARDNAEALLEGLLRTQTEMGANPDRLAELAPEQLARGRQARGIATAAARRMVDALNTALCMTDNDQPLSDKADR